MSRQIAALMFLAGSGAMIGGDQAPLASMPLKLGDNYRLSVSARINGSPVSCSMDSAGGDRVYLDKDKALAMGIQPTSEGRSAGPQAAKMQADSRASVTLELGGLKLAEQTLVMQKRPYAAYACVIGMTVLKRYVVELDYAPPSLRVYEPSRYKYSGPDRAVPFTLDQGSPFVTATLYLPKDEPIEARFAVDTGGGRPAGYLTQSFIRQHDAMDKVSKTVPDLWSGSSGNHPRVLATRFEKLSVGESELPRPVFFLYQTRGFGGANEPDGLLCPDFLRRFNLVFDYPNQQIIFEPGPQFDDEMPFDSSGTLIYRQGQQPYRVLDVIDGSPAADAGLRKGDIVVDFNGKPAAEMSVREIRDALREEGHDCVLRVQRGSEEVTITLRLRRLI
ncbi:MAG: PDZ domain-containing protein [bacterium]|nr:PDZ domain-containing protein [bacterium]